MKRFNLRVCTGMLILIGGLVSVRLFMSVVENVHKQRAQEAADGLDMTSIIRSFTKHPFVPFDGSQPRKLVILTYQRCGSSFLGQLFNMNPDVFYMYEPLDSLYTALYGVKEGWNVPSDITTYWNGTAREIPGSELKAVSIFLEHLLSCHVTALPTETLIHRFWFMFSYFHESLSKFTKCLTTNNLKSTRCEHFTPGFCGNRFGGFPEERIQDCNRLLWNQQLRESSQNSDMAHNLTRYRTCMDSMRIEVDSQCTQEFSNMCNKAELRVAKTVRATMASMTHVLQTEPNARVIHLIRDPRAVVLSRRNFDNSARSHYAGGSMLREAEVYCRDVVRDVRLRKMIEKFFPKRIMTIVYDDLTKRPIDYAEEIYRFLNTTLPEKTKTWIVKNTSQKKNSTKIASKWQNTVTYQQAMHIMNTCQEFFSLVNYKFS